MQLLPLESGAKSHWYCTEVWPIQCAILGPSNHSPVHLRAEISGVCHHGWPYHSVKWPEMHLLTSHLTVCIKYLCIQRYGLLPHSCCLPHSHWVTTSHTRPLHHRKDEGISISRHLALSPLCKVFIKSEHDEYPKWLRGLQGGCRMLGLTHARQTLHYWATASAQSWSFLALAVCSRIIW